MNKSQFLSALSRKIRKLPKKDINRSVDFYSELIDDYIDNGLTEEKAVEKIGSPEEAADQIMLDAPLGSLIKARVTPTTPLPSWAKIVLICTSPIWFSLAVTAFALFASFFAVVSAVIVSLFATTASLGVSAVALLVASPFMCINGAVTAGLFSLGCAIAGAGVTVFLYYSSVLLTKYLFKLSRLFVSMTKKALIKKEK